MTDIVAANAVIFDEGKKALVLVLAQKLYKNKKMCLVRVPFTPKATPGQ